MKSRLRSKVLMPDVPQYYIRRALMKSMGFGDQDLEKPLVAVANTWNEILPGAYHLNRIGEAVKRGIQGAGEPEAMDGGPIALIRDGDMIEIDIPARKINVDLSKEEMARRREQWKPPEPKVTHGWLAHFAKHATSADKGAYLE